MGEKLHYSWCLLARAVPALGHSGGCTKIPEPEERTASLINLTAKMLYLENNAQAQYSEVKYYHCDILNIHILHAFFYLLFFNSEIWVNENMPCDVYISFSCIL